MPNVTEVRPARRTGRPPLTDRTALLGAARDIGFPGLTVGAVTARVGVKYSTFYRHFPSLEALTAALVTDVLEQASLPEPSGSWQQDVRDTSVAIFDLFSGHPGLAVAIVRLPDLPARLMETYRRLTDSMLKADFAPEDAALGANAVLETVVMPWITTSERGSGFARRHHQTEDEDVAIDPRVRAALADRLDDPPRAWTLDKIELLITGLEFRLSGGRG